MSANAARVDPFHPLLRLVDRYRSDVHELRGPSSEASLDEADRRLRTPVPAGLRAFLLRWDGAILFRGALRVRTAVELAAASERASAVVIFADGPLDDDHWAYAPGDGGQPIFGGWADGVFQPLHERFDRWLSATLRILDENLREPEAQLAARLDADPDSAFLLLRKAEDHLAEGDPDAARVLLRRATASDPGLVPAWERLGELGGSRLDQTQLAPVYAVPHILIQKTAQLALPGRVSRWEEAGQGAHDPWRDGIGGRRALGQVHGTQRLEKGPLGA
ncbi:MAG: hypothetical protein GXP62_17135, partial [Oligoflexia bacterium]|nr:hypothetical protein [Oligoflexia bacterium]